MRTIDPLRQRFRDLHDDGLFVMPNPWDVGSARLLAALGFPALATTSSGHAATLGRTDQHVGRDELLDAGTSTYLSQAITDAELAAAFPSPEL